jgi:hypothetical protein
MSIALFLPYYNRLYSPEYRPLWLEVSQSWVPVWLYPILISTALWISLFLLLKVDSNNKKQNYQSDLTGLVTYGICGFTAYAVIYFLSPGYLLTGYLWRFAPFFVYISDVVIAIGFYLAINIFFTTLWKPWFKRIAIARIGSEQRHTISDSDYSLSKTIGKIVRESFSIIISLAFFPLLISYWFVTQLTFIRLMPPNHWSFLKDLRFSPYLGSSFVVNNYAAPIAEMTEEWAYYDPEFSKGVTFLTNTGYLRNYSNTYLWLADKDSNQEYRKPDYFACMTQQTLESAVAFLPHRNQENDEQFRGNCENLDLVQSAKSLNSSLLQDQLAAEDLSGQHFWSIIKLDWDFPPYLEKLSNSQDDDIWVSPQIQAVDGKITISADYAYQHQEDSPEAGSLLRLYGIEGSQYCLLEEQTIPNKIVLPDSIRGDFILTVTPKSETKYGLEYSSSVINLGGQSINQSSCDYVSASQVDKPLTKNREKLQTVKDQFIFPITSIFDIVSINRAEAGFIEVRVTNPHTQKTEYLLEMKPVGKDFEFEQIAVLSHSAPRHEIKDLHPSKNYLLRLRPLLKSTAVNGQPSKQFTQILIQPNMDFIEVFEEIMPTPDVIH